MAHFEQMQFFEAAKQSLIPDGKKISVLEVGSHNVNGGLRSIFPNSDYLGIDLSPGDGVDIVYDGSNFDFLNKKKFDLIISGEVFEHNPNYKSNVKSLRKHLKKDGFLIISTATLGRLEHGTRRTNINMSPGTAEVDWNYYQNVSKGSLRRALKSSEYNILILQYNHWVNDLYCIASGSDMIPDNLKEIKERVRLNIENITPGDFDKYSIHGLEAQPKKLWLVSFRYLLPRIIGEKMYQNFYLWLKKVIS